MKDLKSTEPLRDFFILLSWNLILKPSMLIGSALSSLMISSNTSSVELQILSLTSILLELVNIIILSLEIVDKVLSLFNFL